MFLLSLRQLPRCGGQTPASVPHLPRAGLVLLTPLFSPPSFFILPGFAWFYIVFSTGQVLLSALSWCSACTSVSEGVFLMCLWREMYSMSTYSSVSLFSPTPVVLNGVGSRIMPPWGHVTISGMSAVVIARGRGEGSMAPVGGGLGNCQACNALCGPHRTEPAGPCVHGVEVENPEL